MGRGPETGTAGAPARALPRAHTATRKAARRRPPPLTVTPPLYDRRHATQRVRVRVRVVRRRLRPRSSTRSSTALLQAHVPATGVRRTPARRVRTRPAEGNHVRTTPPRPQALPG